MKLTAFGEKFTAKSGILELMDDLGKATAGSERVCMLGGGNPAQIPEVQAVWRESLERLTGDGEGLEKALSSYDDPQGRPGFLEALAHMFRSSFGWEIGPENIAITNGSQSAFFILFNLFAGSDAEGRKKKVLFPLCPEYIGYADQCVEQDSFTTRPARIELSGDYEYKYHVDFSGLEIGDDIGAVCVSRPTNPTGNVISDEELAQLSELAEKAGVPLIVDNAYGLPFPGIIFEDVKPFWNGNTILSMSLSKIGLPSVRTGIIIADPEVITALTACNAIINLANGNIGQVLTESFIRSGEILRLSRDVVGPFYRKKSLQAQEWLEEYMPSSIDFRIHKSEGAIFLWIWFRNLSVSSRELYERLKKRRVIVVPGEYFFFGLEKDWEHSRQCIRLNYAQDAELVEEGIRILAEEAARVVKE
jgi:valine--pyruvate aminotransferase